MSKHSTTSSPLGRRRERRLPASTEARETSQLGDDRGEERDVVTISAAVRVIGNDAVVGE